MAAPLSAAPSTAALVSEGQRMFLAVQGSTRAIAKEVGCNHQSIQNWLTGAKSPSQGWRKKLWKLYGVPERAWTIRPGGALDAPPAAELATEPTPSDDTASPSTLDHCLELLREARHDRKQSGLLASERARIANTEAALLKLRSQLEGAAELSEARYVAQHPAWHQLRRTILRALEPYPLAVKAIAEAIKNMEPK